MIKLFIDSDGSNANNMINFSNRYNDVVQVKLEDNFRSIKGIVDIADHVIENNENRLQKKMFSNKEIDNSRIEAIRYENEEEQYLGIAEEIQKLNKQEIKYKDIAILVRKGKFISSIAAILDSKNIPYDTDNAEYFFNGNYFEKFVITLQLLTELKKDVLYDCWKDYIDVSKFTEGFRYLRKAINGNLGDIYLSEILINFLNVVGFLEERYEDIEIRKSDLKGITDILNDYDEIYADFQLSAKINGLLDFLSREAAEQYKYHNFKEKDKNLDAVQILTVHKSKGLEYNTVFIPNLEKMEFPARNVNGKKYWHVLGEYFKKNKDKYEGDIEDERKLFYVAVTRAKQNLFLTYEFSEQSISEFVKEASESGYLEIDYDDLTYEVPSKSDISISTSINNLSSDAYLEYNYSNQSNMREKQYRELVRYARKQLFDYYGTAMHFFVAAMGDIERIKKMSGEEVIQEAMRLHLI